MALHLHKGIGWAMPYEDFWKHLKRPFRRGECLSDELDALDDYAHLVYQGDLPEYKLIASPVITDNRGIEPLIQIVGNGDDMEHVLFYPNLELKQKWYRFDDEMDWTFAREMLKVGGGINDYLDAGIHPFEHERMDMNGVRVEPGRDDMLWEFERDPSLIVGVPDVLRWWLLHTGIFDLDGVAALRPFRGLWWG